MDVTMPGWLARWLPAAVVVGFVACLVAGAFIGGAAGKQRLTDPKTTISTREFLLRVPTLEIERICRTECSGGFSSLPAEVAR